MYTNPRPTDRVYDVLVNRDTQAVIHIYIYISTIIHDNNIKQLDVVYGLIRGGFHGKLHGSVALFVRAAHLRVPFVAKGSVGSGAPLADRRVRVQVHPLDAGSAEETVTVGVLWLVVIECVCASG